MSSQTSSIPETYVKLALTLDQHIDGYVDSYFGPPEWRTDAQTAGKLPLDELEHRADDLMAGLQADTVMDAQRRNFLSGQVRAMQTAIAMAQGEQLSIKQETEGLYDVTPHYIDEAVFEETHRSLAELLPPGGTLTERMLARRELLKFPFDRLAPLVPAMLQDLRARTAAKFPLPEYESFEFIQVKDKPWGAYNWYQGNFHSIIEWNTDLPASINIFPVGLAHEGYPGHHTEHAIKEKLLVRDGGRIEHSVTVLNAPECTIAEGVATTAFDIICSPQDQIDLFQKTIYPALGLDLDAARELEIERIADTLYNARSNAVYLLHEQHQTPDEVTAYLQRYALMEEPNAQKAVRFHELYRSYTFTYIIGKELLLTLFAKRGNPVMWYRRLLTEPVTPQQVRDWTAGIDS